MNNEEVSNVPEGDAMKEVKYWKDKYASMEDKFTRKIADLEAAYKSKIDKEVPETCASKISASTDVSPSSQLILELKSDVGKAMTGLTQIEQKFQHAIQCQSIKLTHVEEKVLEIDQYNCRPSLVVHGLTGIPKKQYGSEFYKFILEFLNNNLPSMECLVERNHIDIAHTLKTKKEGRKSVLLIKFANRWVRDMIFYSKSDLKKSAKGIAITEHLRPHTIALLEDAKKVFGRDNVWIKNGIVHTNISGNKTQIHNFRQLNALIAPNHTLSVPSTSNSNILTPDLQNLYKQQQPPPGFLQFNPGYSNQGYNPNWNTNT